MELRFSVVVPIYNVEDFLEQCIESVLNQTYTNFELILVDDGATDQSGRICDDYAKKDDRIVVIHKKNGGLVSAREAGVMVEKGQYVGYVDGDDWVDEKWLHILNEIIIKQSAPDIIEYNVYKSTDGVNKKIQTSNFRGYLNRNDIKNKIIPNMICDKRKNFYSFGILPAVWSKVFKRELLKRNLCKEKKITFGEDVSCTYNCILGCESFYGSDEHLYYYRQNNQSMTKAYDARRFERLKVLFEYLNENLIMPNEELREQFYEYKMFCLLYAMINEAKSGENYQKLEKKCKKGIFDLKQREFIQNYKSNKLGIPWNILFLLMKKENYKLLMCICRMIVKIKYTYKQ